MLPGSSSSYHRRHYSSPPNHHYHQGIILCVLTLLLLLPTSNNAFRGITRSCHYHKTPRLATQDPKAGKSFMSEIREVTYIEPLEIKEVLTVEMDAEK